MRETPTGEASGVFFSVEGGVEAVKAKVNQTYRDRLEALLAEETLGFSEKIRAILGLGAEWLGVENGHLTSIDPAASTHVIEEVSGPHPTIEKGRASDLSDTYCRKVLANGKALAIENAPEQGWKGDPAYRAWGLSTYLGAKVVVSETLRGTVCFVGEEPRGEPFREPDAAALALLARSIGQVLEQRRGADRLRRTRARLEAIFEGAPDMICLFDVEGTLMVPNPRLQEETGYEAKELVGMKVWDLDRDLEPEEARARWVEMGPREALRREGRYRRKDGTEFPVEMKVQRLKLEGDTQFVMVARDITGRKEKEKRLRVLSEAMGQAKEAVLITEAGPLDEPGPRIEYVNESFEQMTGYAEEEILGETPRILQGPETERAVLDSLRDALEAGQEWEGEVVNYCKEGTPYRVQWNVAPVRGEDGSITRWVSVQRDVTEERRREEALKDREARLRGIANSIPGVVFQFAPQPDGTFGFNFIGERAGEMLGISPRTEGFLDRALACVPEPTDQKVRASIEEAIRRQEAWHEEFPFERPSGETLWILGTATPQETEGEPTFKGEPTFNGVFLDITERKVGERRHQQVIRRVTDAIVEVDSEWQFTLVNDEAEALYETSEEALLGRNFWEVFEEARGTRFEDVYRRVMQTREPGSLVERFSQLGGWFDVEVYPNEDGGLSFYFQEVTDLKKQKRALRERQEKVEALYETTGKLLRASSREEVPALVHETFHEVFEYPLVHTALVEGDTIVPKKTSAPAGEALRVPRAQPRPASGNTVAARALRSGEAVVVEDTKALGNPIDYGDLRSAAGVPIGGHGVVVIGQVEEAQFEDTPFDPFDLHLLEILTSHGAATLDLLEQNNALREAKEEAERMNRLKSAFLANMSHEIRTPLTSILGFAGAIGEEARGASAAEEVDLKALAKFSGLIEKSGQRLMETLTGVLNFSRLEAGEMPLSPEPVDLALEVEETVEEFLPRAEEAGIQLTADLEGSVWAEANEGGLHIVLRNLLSNAIKYTEEGGQVWVRTRVEENLATLEVEDTGIGIDPAHTEELFEPFKQASEGMAREYEGTGLGLAVTKKVLEQMGGSIEVETEKGEGSRFTIRLPTASETGEDA